MSKEIKEFDMNKKPRKALWYLRPIEWIGAWWLAGIFGTRTKFIHHGFKSYREPALILSNHASMVDFANILVDMFPYRQCWVVSIEEFLGREFLMRGVGGIPKRKFTTDLIMIKHVAEMIRKKHCSVVIYPEARFTIAGINEDIGTSLGKMAKLCQCRVLVMNQKGNFLRSPQWNKHPYRKVRVIAETTQVVSKKEVMELPAEEIQKRIADAMIYDEYKWQAENKIKIKSKARAQNIHKILYKCPVCGNEHEMDSNGTQIFCNNCHTIWDMDEYGLLHQQNGDTRFSLVSDWYRWEREEANKEVNEGSYHISTPVRLEKLVNSKIGFQKVGIVNMTHDENGFVFDGILDDGSHYHLEKPCQSTRSVHIEYDYKKRGDALDVATLDETWFAFPFELKNCLTKFNFTTEALFFKTEKLKKKEG